MVNEECLRGTLPQSRSTKKAEWVESVAVGGGIDPFGGEALR